LGYKIIANQAPFPDDAAVSATIGALDTRRTKKKLLMANEISAKQKTLAASGQAKSATPAGLLQSNGKSRLLSDEEKVSVHAATAREPWGPINTATVVFNMLALPGAICTITTSGLKLGVSPDTWPRSVKCALFIGNLMYIAPNYKAWPNADSWPMLMNDICFGLCVIKS